MMRCCMVCLRYFCVFVGLIVFVCFVCGIWCDVVWFVV